MIRSARAQSAVIGTVLLVGIVVVISGTVMLYGGTLGSELSEPAPISLEAEQASSASPYESGAALRIAHTGGPDVATDDLAIVVDGERVANRSNLSVMYSASTFGVGEYLVVKQTDSAGFTGGEEVLLLRDTGDSAFRLRAFTVEDGGPGAGPSVFGFEASEVGEGPADPWRTEQSGAPSSTLEVRNSQAASGGKALYLSTSSNGARETSSAQATISIDLSDVAEVRIDYYDQNDAQIRIDGEVRAGDGDGAFGSNNDYWETVSIDTTSDSGPNDLTLFNSENTVGGGGSGSAQVYFDDIRFYDADGDRIAAEDVLP